MNGSDLQTHSASGVATWRCRDDADAMIHTSLSAHGVCEILYFLLQTSRPISPMAINNSVEGSGTAAVEADRLWL